MANPIPETFLFTVYDETGVLFQNQVTAIEAVNEEGPLSVLSGHTNFISVIKGSLTQNLLVAHLPDGTKHGFILQQGVLKVFNNQAEVFIVFDLAIPKTT